MDRVVEQELFPRSIEAVLLNANYVAAEGWQLLVRARREGQTWDEGYRCSYERLTGLELQSVVDGELFLLTEPRATAEGGGAA